MRTLWTIYCSDTHKRYNPRQRERELYRNKEISAQKKVNRAPNIHDVCVGAMRPEDKRGQPDKKGRQHFLALYICRLCRRWFLISHFCFAPIRSRRRRCRSLAYFRGSSCLFVIRIVSGKRARSVGSSAFNLRVC